MPTTLALDIETISPHLDPDETPNFDDPRDFELAAIGFATASSHPRESPRTEVLFRSAPGVQGEIEFLQRVSSALARYDPDRIVTYAGDRFDLPLLRHRPVYAQDTEPDEGIAGEIRTTLSTAESVDLSDPAADTYGYGTRLEDLIDYQADLEPRRTRFEEYDHGLDLETVRPSDATAPSVSSSDIPGIMETWLHARSADHEDRGPCNVAETQKMLTDYVLGDIEHLLALDSKRPFTMAGTSASN